MCKSRTGVHPGKFPVAGRTLFCRRCNFSKCLSAASSLAGQALSHDTPNESESYITTNSQAASLSWNKAQICGLRPDFCNCQTVAGLLMWDVFL
jgi:hypothetical protein